MVLAPFLHLLKWMFWLQLHSLTVNFLLTKFLLFSIEIASLPTLANIQAVFPVPSADPSVPLSNSDSSSG